VGRILAVHRPFYGGRRCCTLAMIATFFKGMWAELGELVVLIALTFGVRVWGYNLVERALRNAPTR